MKGRGTGKGGGSWCRGEGVEAELVVRGIARDSGAGMEDD